MNFGARLEGLAKLVPEGLSVVDVGTDHAYLPLLLAQRGNLPHAIAGDIALGPCEAARRTVAAYGLKKLIEVRQGDGLAVVSPGEAQVIVLAGMGAQTMIDILGAAPEIVTAAEYLVLQPMNEEARLRAYLRKIHWHADKENLLEENGRLYTLCRYIKGDGEQYPEIYDEVGPLLIREKHQLLKKKLAYLKEKWSRQLASMEQSSTARESKKYKELRERLNELEGLQ